MQQDLAGFRQPDERFIVAGADQTFAVGSKLQGVWAVRVLEVHFGALRGIVEIEQPDDPVVSGGDGSLASIRIGYQRP